MICWWVVASLIRDIVVSEFDHDVSYETIQFVIRVIVHLNT